MTMAVCFKCGEIKSSAFVRCPACSALPEKEKDIVLSYAMSDHFYDVPTLKQMGAAIRDGNPPRVDPQIIARSSDATRRTGTPGKLAKVGEIFHGQAPPAQEQPPPKKRWWRFW
jgi:hypothetical protein